MIKIQKNKMENYLHVSLYIVKKFIQKLINLRKNMGSLILWKSLYLVLKVWNNSKRNLYFIIWTDCRLPISSVNGDSISYFQYNAFVWYSFIFCDKKEKHTSNDSLCFSSLNLKFHVPSNSLLTKNTKDEYFNVFLLYFAWQNLMTKWQMYTFHLTKHAQSSPLTAFSSLGKTFRYIANSNVPCYTSTAEVQWLA